MKVLPLSLVIPTSGRSAVLQQMLESVLIQGVWPREIMVVDASSDTQTVEVCRVMQERFDLFARVLCIPAKQRGAAAQRNQGVGLVRENVIGFADDDVVLEAHALERVWNALHLASDNGGASAMITNQKYHEPGRVSRLVYRLIGGGLGPDYAGKIFGPAVNLLPADREEMPEVVSVGWLNLGLTLYRREALPDPPFDPMFTGYSMMEDVALSLVVARKWKLVNARTARIFHDTQTGSHKSDLARVARMGVVNRDFVARRVQGIQGFRYWVWLMIWGAFQMIATMIGSLHNPKQWRVLKGSLLGYFDILVGRSLPPF